MRKTEFLERLRAALNALPEEEAKKTIAYYAEMIDDRIEDGMSEEEAVAGLGEPEAVAREILLDAPWQACQGKNEAPTRAARLGDCASCARCADLAATACDGSCAAVYGLCRDLVNHYHTLGSLCSGAAFRRCGNFRQRMDLDAEYGCGFVCAWRSAGLLRYGNFRIAGDEGTHCFCRSSDG